MDRFGCFATTLLLKASLVVCLMASASAMLTTSAWANEPTSQEVLAGQAAQTESIERTWIKAGKKLYRWQYDNSGNNIKNGYLQICKKAFAATGMARDIANSNPDVVSFSYKRNSDEGDEAGEYYGTIKYAFKKYGSATISYRDFRIGYGSGGRTPFDVTENLRYVKYTNPLKKFSIGSKNYAKRFKSQPYCLIKSSKLKGKLKVKAKKGWKVVQIRKLNANLEHEDFDKQLVGGKAKWKLKNGKKLSINNTAKKIDNETAVNIEVICYNKAKRYYTSVILFPGTYLYDAVFG